MNKRSADLFIATLDLELPASLGARKHSIVRLLRAELNRLEWPGGELQELVLPPLVLSCQQTNLAIARALAQALLLGVNNRVNARLAAGGRS